MKRRALIRHLEQHGCVLLREGSRHSLYCQPTTDRTSAVPRHTEIGEGLARKICKDLGIPPL
ncbi:MAG TPA: type II toxin-antitoxin system HicA family toxin [Thermoanaerobaculia bacterium]|nr:type II toxin-antitoxin system HicA family toxin [Thermoanaerobaculia bacterium]